MSTPRPPATPRRPWWWFTWTPKRAAAAAGFWALFLVLEAYVYIAGGGWLHLVYLAFSGANLLGTLWMLLKFARGKSPHP